MREYLINIDSTSFAYFTDALSAGGGDARYGNEEFLKNVEAWAASVKDYPEYV